MLELDLNMCALESNRLWVLLKPKSRQSSNDEDDKIFVCLSHFIYSRHEFLGTVQLHEVSMD